MKNIAEYFRDLAAGDRFFGAEPPQPDPEMLQSIAEQTIKTRVNAQLSDNNNLVLRQDDTAPASAAVIAPVAAAITPQVAPVAAPGVETVAEKLQRIRAVVSRETAQDALFSEDQHVDEFASETTAPFGGFETDDSTPDTAEIASPSEEFEDDSATSDIDLSSLVADTPTDADEAPSEDVAEDVTEDTTDLDATSREDAAETAVDSVLGRVDDEDAGEDAAPRRRIVVQKITREDLKAVRKEADDKAADDVAVQEDATVQDDALDDADTPDTASDSELPPEHEEELLRELAALQEEDAAVAVVEDTVENDAAVEGAVEDDATAEIEFDEQSAEDDLAEALSDLVSEDADEYKREELTAAREIRRARRDAITEDDEDDVERLISTTTSRIDSDESSQRRASIAHLKAAVAATKADSSLAGAALEQEARERDQYAEDLARVVRPERKAPTGERAKTDRPAPLVLVSELRIDKDEDDAETPDTDDTSDGPVRPRRISRDAMDSDDAGNDGNIFSDADQASFADYAASANALELPDLLEAAAAYYTYVESTEQFTRPMLMRKIASISERDGFSREAGLRSFGTLLREGKLVKGTDGKFVIAKTSRFTPEARYAGE